MDFQNFLFLFSNNFSFNITQKGNYTVTFYILVCMYGTCDAIQCFGCHTMIAYVQSLHSTIKRSPLTGRMDIQIFRGTRLTFFGQPMRYYRGSVPALPGIFSLVNLHILHFLG
jgi:hypothetical protein